MAERDPYFLGHSVVEQQRLQQQARELADESRRFFQQIAIPAAARVVEIGCGPQGCLGILADRVGPTGAVVGVEMSEHAVELARRFVAERGLTNVEVRHADPEEVVAEMVALVRPGGTVALHEADWCAHVCDPPLPAWDRLFTALRLYSESNGIDLFIGRRVPRMLRAAGLVDVQIHPLIHVYAPGNSRRPIFLQFVSNLRDRIVAHGLITEAEFGDAIKQLADHLDDPATVVVSHLFFQAWGRKPG